MMCGHRSNAAKLDCKKAMAMVVAHEYPKVWLKILSYGAVAAVIAGRLLAHDHWPADLFVGPTLGYFIGSHFIGSHIFHLHGNPQLRETCHLP
jgi:hypothetical protein